MNLNGPKHSITPVSRSAKTLEVIIPAYNEEAMVKPLSDRLLNTFSRESLASVGLERVLFRFVDDGSSDRTAQFLAELIENGFPAVIHILSRNFGHQAAVTAGLENSNSDLVAVMDADLQDPPEIILEMVKKWQEGFDVVYGQRSKRKENIVKVFCYWAFYRVLAFLAEVDIPLDTGDFCLMDRRVVSVLNSMPEKLRFPRGLRAWIGFRQFGLAYERQARKSGRAKYTVKMLYRLATDGIASMSIRVLQITQLFTFLFSLAALGFAVYAFRELIHQQSTQPLAIWFVVGYLLNSLAAAMVLFSLYIMSAYLGRTYLEAKNRPVYIMARTIGVEEPAKP